MNMNIYGPNHPEFISRSLKMETDSDQWMLQ